MFLWRKTWHLRHWWHFWQLRTTIWTIILWPLNTEWWWQHSQFLRCLKHTDTDSVPQIRNSKKPYPSQPDGGFPKLHWVWWVAHVAHRQAVIHSYCCDTTLWHGAEWKRWQKELLLELPVELLSNKPAPFVVSHFTLLQHISPRNFHP